MVTLYFLIDRIELVAVLLFPLIQMKNENFVLFPFYFILWFSSTLLIALVDYKILFYAIIFYWFFYCLFWNRNRSKVDLVWPTSVPPLKIAKKANYGKDHSFKSLFCRSHYNNTELVYYLMTFIIIHILQLIFKSPVESNLWSVYFLCTCLNDILIFFFGFMLHGFLSYRLHKQSRKRTTFYWFTDFSFAIIINILFELVISMGATLINHSLRIYVTLDHSIRERWGFQRH